MVLLSFAMESDILFKVEKKKTGRICHQFYDQRNGFKYHRKTLKPTGQAYFVCCEKNCNAKITANYAIGNTEEEPNILQLPAENDHSHGANIVTMIVKEAIETMKEKSCADSFKSVQEVYESDAMINP